MTAPHIAILAGYFVLALALLNWSRSGIVRGLTGVFFLAAIGATAYAAVDGMGRPRAIGLDLSTSAGCYAVHSFDFAEGRAIYLWLDVGDERSPLLLDLPWDIHAAQALVNAAQQAAQNGAPLQVGLKGGKCGEGQQGADGAETGAKSDQPAQTGQQTTEFDAQGYDAAVFYAAPPAEMPPKS